MFQIDKIRKDFPMLQNKMMQEKPLVYFDNAATTFKPYMVLDAIKEYYEDMTSNAHRGDYDLSYRVDQAYEGVREKIAKFLNCQSKEVVFTSGASEGLNLIANGYQSFLQPNDIVLSTEAEHASCVLPWMRVCEKQDAILSFVPLTKEGRMDFDAFSKMMSNKVKVVVLAHITNVFGYIAPIKEICKIAHQYGAIVVVDGAQSVPHMPIDVQQYDCDFLVFSAHKMCGPTGSGVVYGKYHLLEKLEPLLLGGGSNARFDMCGNIMMKHAPFKFESGTPNIEGVLGLGAAISYLTSIGMNNIYEYECELHQYAIEHLKKMNHIILYNENSDSGIITFNVKGVFAQDVASYFNAQGIAVRSGQHCAKMLIEALQTSATVRASLYFYNTKEEVDRFLEACAKVNAEACLDIFF